MTTVNVTFTFCAQRESNPQVAKELFRKHFPGAFALGYHNGLDTLYRVKCTSDEFVQWMHERDEMGFVNRIRQLNMVLEVSKDHHFPRAQASQPQMRLRQIEYTTLATRGMQ